MAQGGKSREEITVLEHTQNLTTRLYFHTLSASARVSRISALSKSPKDRRLQSKFVQVQVQIPRIFFPLTGTGAPMGHNWG